MLRYALCHNILLQKILLPATWQKCRTAGTAFPENSVKRLWRRAYQVGAASRICSGCSVIRHFLRQTLCRRSSLSSVCRLNHVLKTTCLRLQLAAAHFQPQPLFYTFQCGITIFTTQLIRVNRGDQLAIAIQQCKRRKRFHTNLIEQ